MHYLVSIIMPAYNAEKHIAESIQSVLAQTYQNWELIVVDDGSVDRTAEIARSFSSLDQRIKYVFQQNKMLAGARNTGIKNSTGDIIAFLDSDDLWMSEKLELQVKKMEEVNADIVFSDGFIFPEDDTRNETRTFSAYCGQFSADAMFSLLLAENRIPVLSVLARKEALREVGLFNEDPCYYGLEDYELWLRLAKHGAAFYGMKEKLVRYRVHANAMSSNKVSMLKAEIAAVEKHRCNSTLDTEQMKRRSKELYRALIFVLLKDSRLTEARECMRGLAILDNRGVVTLVQSKLLKTLPGRFNYISQHLYTAEYLVKALMSIRGKRTISRVKKFCRKFTVRYVRTVNLILCLL